MPRRSFTAPGPPFTYRIGQRPDRELRVNVKEFKIRNQTKTSNERQAAADQVPPRSINDPGPIRELAERLDDLTTAVAKSSSIRRLARKRADGLEADARELSRPQGGHRHSRAPRQPARSDRRRVCTAAPRRRARARTPCLPTRNRAGCLSIRTAGEPRSAGPAGAARSRRPRADRQARRAGLPGVLLRPSRRRGSARSSSA